MNVDRTTDNQTNRQTTKMKGKGGDDAVDLIIIFNILISFNDTTREVRSQTK